MAKNKNNNYKNSSKNTTTNSNKNRSQNSAKNTHAQVPDNSPSRSGPGGEQKLLVYGLNGADSFSYVSQAMSKHMYWSAPFYELLLKYVSKTYITIHNHKKGIQL